MHMLLFGNQYRFIVLKRVIIGKVAAIPCLTMESGRDRYNPSFYSKQLLFWVKSESEQYLCISS